MKLELSSLKKSIAALERVINVYQLILIKSNTIFTAEIEAIQSGIIQNFGVAYEQCLKFMKRWKEENVGNQEVDGVPRRELFRVSVENHLILDVEEWMTFHRARNLTSHTYDEENAKHVMQIACTFLLPAKNFLQQLENRNV